MPKEIFADWTAAARAKAKTRFFISHGSSDGVVSPEVSAHLRELLAAAGHDVQFVPHEGGHEVPLRVLHAAGAFLRAE